MSGSEDWLQQLPQNIVIGLEQGSMYSLIALGYTLVYGVLQLINFSRTARYVAQEAAHPGINRASSGLRPSACFPASRA